MHGLKTGTHIGFPKICQGVKMRRKCLGDDDDKDTYPWLPAGYERKVDRLDRDHRNGLHGGILASSDEN